MVTQSYLSWREVLLSETIASPTYLDPWGHMYKVGGVADPPSADHTHHTRISVGLCHCKGSYMHRK